MDSPSCSPQGDPCTSRVGGKGHYLGSLSDHKHGGFLAPPCSGFSHQPLGAGHPEASSLWYKDTEVEDRLGIWGSGQYSPWGIHIPLSESASNSHFPYAHAHPLRQQVMGQKLGSLPVTRETLMALACPNPGCCGHLRNEQTSGRLISLCLSNKI